MPLAAPRPTSAHRAVLPRDPPRAVLLHSTNAGHPKKWLSTWDLLGLFLLLGPCSPGTPKAPGPSLPWPRSCGTVPAPRSTRTPHRVADPWEPLTPIWGGVRAPSPNGAVPRARVPRPRVGRGTRGRGLTTRAAAPGVQHPPLLPPPTRVHPPLRLQPESFIHNSARRPGSTPGDAWMRPVAATGGGERKEGGGGTLRCTRGHAGDAPRGPTAPFPPFPSAGAPRVGRVPTPQPPTEASGASAQRRPPPPAPRAGVRPPPASHLSLPHAAG